MRTWVAACALALVVSLGCVTPARAGSVIVLGDFIPNGINGHRQIVGDTIDPNNDDAPPHAAIWTGGVLKRLAEPSGTAESDAYGLNADGRIVGDSVSNGQLHAIYWDGPDGAPHQLGPLSAPPDDFSFATAVDAAGDVVGNTLDTKYQQFGFFSSRGSGVTPVGDADRGEGTATVAGITADGTKMLGHVNASSSSSAREGWYLWTSPSAAGTKLDLTIFPTGSHFLGAASTQQFANQMASDGSVVGYKGTDSYYLRAPNGAETPVIGLVGHNGVNAKHTVIGTVLSSYMGQPIPHAAIWKPDGSVVDLNTQLGPNSDLILVDALAINDNGDIAGTAGQISTGRQVGFLLPAGYVVDSTGDEADKTPGDGNCATATATCTLRAAVQEINGDQVASPTAITFSVTGTIAPASALPAVKYPIAIDGGTKVTLNGAGAGAGVSGLVLQGKASTVRGLEIDNFKAAGVRIEASNVSVGGLLKDTPPCAFPCNTFKGQAGPAIAVASGTQNLLQGNRLTGNGRPAIDLGADGRTPNDAKDADGGANGRHNFPIGVLAARDPVSKVLVVSGVDAADVEAGDAIDVYAQSAASAARGAEPTDHVGSTEVNYMGAWVLDVPASLPADDTVFSATITTGQDGTSELSPICSGDSDGDGLCDDWELHGIDADDDGTADLTLEGASTGHKDLYLEVDTMTNIHGTNRPEPGVFDDVTKAFADAPILNASGGNGIALHITPVGDIVPETSFNVAGTGPGSLSYLAQGSLSEPCDGSFGSHDDRAAPDCFKRLAARALAYRWVLFGYDYNEESGSSGFADGLGGSRLTVTLGKWGDTGVIAGGGGLASCQTLANCRRITQAGTLMHEFGHSLGLHHGGRDDTQFKPNYLSVMNYMFQTRMRVADRPMDYSRFALAPLDEHALVDGDGIGTGLGGALVSALWPHTGYYRAIGNLCYLFNAPTSGPIDWDGSLPTLTSSVLLHDKFCGGAQQTLTSTADWPDLRYSFRDQPGASDLPQYAGDATVAHEETVDDLIAEKARSDVDGNGISDLADACRIVAGTDVADANANGFADACEADMNRLQAFPSQPGGSGGGGSGGGGAPAGPAKDTTAPALSGLKARPSIAQRAKGRRKAKPATLRFSVTEASTVTFTAEQVAKGRKAGKRCVAGAKKGKSCTLYKKLSGSQRVDARAGANTVSFAAKLGTKQLGAGTFRLTAVAIDAAGNRSKPLTVKVTVR